MKLYYKWSFEPELDYCCGSSDHRLVDVHPKRRIHMRFLWCDLLGETQLSVCEWQVLPFGTTCLPCCATYVVQKDAIEQGQLEDVCKAVQQHFYVDNWLLSFPEIEMAWALVDKMRKLLFEGGYELRQWASNAADIIHHLPKEVLSHSGEHWLNQSDMDPQEPALGLRWLCQSDTLMYKSYILKSPPSP